MTIEQLKEVASLYDIKIAVSEEDEQTFLSQGYEYVDFDALEFFPTQNIEYSSVRYTKIETDRIASPKNRTLAA